MSKAWEIENFLTVKDDELLIDGVRAVDLANEYSTPLFVFSETRIRRNIERLKRAGEFIDCRLKVCYAAKANSNMAILRAVKDAGGELEVNSGGELWKALQIGFTGEQIIFNGTSKEVWEIENAIDAGIYAIQVDSLYELSLIEATARRLEKRANVSLRLVQEIKTGTHSGLQTALLTSKFGMMPDEALEAFQTYKDSEFLNLAGVHLHIGSQNPAAEPYSEALRTLFENLEKIYLETGLKLSHLNLGGGFPVNYLRDNSHEADFPPAQREMFAADFEPSDAVRKAWLTVKEAARSSHAENLLENLTLLIEPGRSVISDAGICLTTVRNRKTRPIVKSGVLSLESEVKDPDSRLMTSDSRLKTQDSGLPTDSWLLTDAGFNILLSMETYKWYYHLISAARAGAEHNFPYKIAGPLCDGGDVYFDIEGASRLPDYRLLPENVEPGEILALLNCGAYSVAQMFQYNGRFLPAIVMIGENGAIETVRRRDTFEDLVNNDIW